jgi:hypothetical protein
LVQVTIYMANGNTQTMKFEDRNNVEELLEQVRYACRNPDSPIDTSGSGVYSVINGRHIVQVTVEDADD